MSIADDYAKHGYSKISALIPPAVAAAMMTQIWRDIRDTRLQRVAGESGLLRKPAFELHSDRYPPLAAFLWGLTPFARQAVGAELLPSFAFFRLYQGEDICRVHSDRPACEHSISLTLAYSDERTWPFHVGTRDASQAEPSSDTFGDDDYATIAMMPGDAVLYRGMKRRHGRILPNPNKWSGHVFLNWVEADGRFSGEAFDSAWHARKRAKTAA